MLYIHHTHTDMSIHEYTCICIHKWMHRCIYMCRCTQMHVQIHVHAQTHAQTCMHIYRCTQPHILRYAHVCSLHMHTYTGAHTQVPALDVGTVPCPCWLLAMPSFFSAMGPDSIQGCHVTGADRPLTRAEPPLSYILLTSKRDRAHLMAQHH